MTADEIRKKWYDHDAGLYRREDADVFIKFEIAAQLAELNQFLRAEGKVKP